MGFFRPTFAEIDLGALTHNFEVVTSCIPGDVGVMAMVKADAYGHGAIQVSKQLVSSGVDSLGVATVEEGLELREAGIKSPIVVMGGLMGMGSTAAGVARGADLTPVVHTVETLELLDATGKAAAATVKIHLKIDSGMTRLGALPSRVDRLLEVLRKCENIKLCGVMTHFAEAEDEEYTEHQAGIFKNVAERIGKEWGPVDVWHMANSAATIDGKFVITDGKAKNWVRPGLMLYGAYPTPEYRNKVELKPVMSLKSVVALKKTVPAGTKVSYGCTFETERKSSLAVIPMGYADGYPWSLSSKGHVLIGGKRVPVVGRVTMDMIIVDITDIKARVGDEVVLLGRQGDEEISVDELADLAGSISYEFFCGISKRMPRVYVNG